MEDNRIDEIIEELQSLRLQVESLEAELRQRNRESVAAPTGPPPNRHYPHTFARGDRVRILNKIKKPATWDNRVAWSEEDARNATVTEVRDRQIFFITDNGIETWRAPNNLRKLAVTARHE